MTQEQQDVLTRVWEVVFGRLPAIKDTGHDPESYGNEFSVDGIAVWPSEEEHVRGWVVARYLVSYNYPHAPDDAELVDSSFHQSWPNVVLNLVNRHAAEAAIGVFDRMADEAYEKEMEKIDGVP